MVLADEFHASQGVCGFFLVYVTMLEFMETMTMHLSKSLEIWLLAKK